MITKIESIITKILGRATGQVFVSEKPEFGHYSTNAAFFVKEDPQKLADEILRFAQNDKKTKDLFAKVEVKGKFINFWIAPKALAKELVEILDLTKLRKNTKVRKPQKICLEFVSANPTGPLTMANGRGGFLGDVLANVLEMVGHKVTREYIINDAGNQVKMLGESILAALGKMESKEEHYQGEYIKTLARVLESRIKNQESGIDAGEIGRLAAAELLKEIKKSAEGVGIKFDVWFSEYQNLHKKGELKKTLEFLEKSGLVSEHDGATWLKTEDIADDKDRVLIKSDGQPTYFLGDLAYHYDKFIKRKFDKAINIWGADHHGYIARLKAGVKALGVSPERLEIIITQLVRLVEGGKEVRMSKRKGEFVTLDELVKEVGKDAARFFFLMHSPDTHMDFDLALAKEKSAKNPVYYTQYAYVRCGSILAKAKVSSIKYQVSSIGKLNSESELNLLKELVKLPDVIQQTAEDYQVSRLVRYSLEVARALNNFYEKERVIDEGGKVVEPRLALVSATRDILEKVFELLGIAAPKKM